jgi:UDP-2,3-diacylglucosamine pyrophosphatase LpxH
MTVQSFDELHVISDLHFGGKSGFQIFCQGDTLAAFIRKLAQPSDRQVGLVLNGDIVDFLAEASTTYLDPQGAINKLERIFYEDNAFSGVWSALQNFVAQPNRQLIMVLGNHDIELALPHVAQWLLEKLSNKNPAARGRVTTCFDGTGFACSVGGKRVFCIHGNDIDIWNVVDHKQLVDVSLSVNCGQTPGEWDPNTGTRLVIDVMNKIKRDYPIVDLLKPEVEGVVPVLLCLDPGRLKEITKILTVAAYLSRDVARRAMGFLSAEEKLEKSPISEEEVMSQFLAKYFEYEATEQVTAESLTRDAYRSMEAGVDPVTQPKGETEYLGPLDYLPAIFSSKEKKVEKLRKALKKNLESNRTFDVTHQDDTLNKMDKQIGSNVNYLITGHTHLARAVPRSVPGCYYLNSGTWIRLIQLTEEMLRDPQDFARVYAAFESGSMEQLDGIKDLGPSHNQPLVMLKPTVVSIVEKDGETFGELRHARPDGSLQSIENTRLPRR